MRTRQSSSLQPLRSFRPLLVVLALASSTAFAQTVSPAAVQQIRALIAEKEARTPAQQKIDSQLHYATQMAQGAQIADGVPTLAVDQGARPDGQGQVVVDITATVTQDLLNQIVTLGGQILIYSPRFHSIRARLPLAALELLASRGEVKFIRPAEQPMVNASYQAAARLSRSQRAANVRAQLQQVLPRLATRKGLLAHLGLGFALIDNTGDKAHKADVVRSFGFDGTGVKIGVLSDGVDPLAAMQAAGDLPAVTVLPGQSGSGAEGTAMLQIIYDLAPGAMLYFAQGGPNQAQFATNIVNLRAAGCDIIVDDITFFAEGVFQDGTVAQAVNSVVADGALYFSDAGNEGRLDAGTSGTWEGDFADSGTNLPGIPGGTAIHDFGGGVNSDLISTDAQSGGGFWLKWSDPLGASSNDYDLYMLNSSLTAVVAASTNTQNGSQDPYEYIGCANLPPVPCGRANNRLVIVRKSGAATRALNLGGWRAQFGMATTGCTFGHNAGQNSISMAAVNVATAGGGAFTGGAANPVERYSCDGPRRIFYDPSGNAITPGNVLFGTNGGTVLQKPDMAAADCTPSNTPSFGNPFCGTSAAAPHAGAIAALVKSARPSLTAAQIRKALIASALDDMAPGVDVDSGVGIVMALGAVQSLTTPVTIQSIPAGLVFTTSGAACPAGTFTTPSAQNWSLATTCSVTFASPQTAAGVYQFVDWTDGPTSGQRSITTPTAPTTFTALFMAPPVISKSFSGSTVPVNAATVLTFQITNPNPAAVLSGIGFTDALPSGMVISTPNGLSGSCGGGTIAAAAGNTSINLSGATLAASSACTFSVAVAGTAAGTVNNITTAITSNEAGPGNQATASIVVTAPPSISKTFGGMISIPVGQTATLSYTINNPNIPIGLTGIAFTDPLPFGLVVAAPNGLAGSCGGGTITAVPGSNTIALAGGTLDPTASCTFAVSVLGIAASTTNNLANTLTSRVNSVEAGVGNAVGANLIVGDAFQVSYIANLNKADSFVNLTNEGFNGADPAGDICANIYVFAADQQLAECCACPLTPNHLKTLSGQIDLISNNLTPGVSYGITVALLVSANPSGGTCNASTVTASQLAVGLAAYRTAMHAVPGGSYSPTETQFSPVPLSATELKKLTQYCSIIQDNGSGFGICGSCREGASGASRQ